MASVSVFLSAVSSSTAASNFVRCPDDTVCLNGGRCFLASTSSSPFSVRNESAFPAVGDLTVSPTPMSWFDAYQACVVERSGAMVDATDLQLLSLAEEALLTTRDHHGVWTGSVDSAGRCLAISLPSLSVSAHDCHRRGRFRSMCVEAADGLPGEEGYDGPAYTYSCDCPYRPNDPVGSLNCTSVNSVYDGNGFCIVAEDDQANHTINAQSGDKA